MSAVPRTAFILGITSDIGRELGRRYLAKGWQVAGTYRQSPPADALFNSGSLFECDVSDPGSVRNLAASCRDAGVRWDLFVGAVGTEEPIGPFFDCDFDSWERGVNVNAIGLLRALHSLRPLRAEGRECACVVFSGAGTNSAAVNYSAYSASKILLIKMCELLAAENANLNVVVIGPGIVITKIHQQTLDAGERAGANFQKVARLLESGVTGVSHDDIFACVNWCLEEGRTVTGGRNISLVHDAWQLGGRALAQALQDDRDMYTLRRHKNDWRPA